MGKPIAERLAQAGHTVLGCDPHATANGVHMVEDVSPAEAAPRYVPAEHRRTAAFYRLARARPAGDSRQEP